MATVGTLDVLLRLNSAQFQRNVREATQRAQRFGRDMQRVGRTLSTRVTLPLAAIGAASVKMAVDAEESANKFNVVMGGAADDVRDRFQALQDTIPLTQQQMESLGAGVQDLLVPLGFVREEAANMSADMVELAADLASFNNVAADVPLEALKSALAGQSRPLRQFGIDVSQARLELLALEEGLISEGDALDANARAQAIFIAAQRDSADAIGDAARTADSAANQFRFLRRDLTELAQGIGEVLVPAVVPLVGGLRDVVGVLRDLEPATQRWVVAVAAAAAAVGPLMLAIGTLIKLLPLVAAGIGAVVSPVGLAVAALGSLAFTIGTVARNWTELRVQTELAWAAMVSTVGDSVIAIARWMDGLPFVGGGFAELADTVEAEMSEMLANTGRRVQELEQELSRGFGGSVDHVGELEQALAGAADATGGVAGGATEVANAAGEMADALADQLDLLSTALDLDLEREGLLTEALDLMGELSDVAEDQTKSLEDRNKAQQDFNSLQQAALESMTRQTTDALGVGGVQRMTDELKALPEAATQAQTAMSGIGDAGADAALQFEDEWVSAIQIVGSQMGGLASQVANVVGAFAAGGMEAGVVAGAGLLISEFSGRDHAAEIEQAREEFERALDRFVDGLADRSRIEQLRVDVEQQAQDAMDALIDAIVASFDSMARPLVMQQIEEALAGQDTTEGQLQALEEMFGPKAQEILETYRARMEQIEEQRQQEIASMQDEIAVRTLVAQGRDAEAEIMRLQQRHAEELAQARELEDAALVSQLQGLHEMEEARLRETQAMQEAARMADLMVRALGAIGRGGEAQMLGLQFRQQREMTEAEDATPTERELLGVLHEIEKIDLEAQIAIDRVNDQLREQLERMDAQIDVARDALRVASGQLREQERSVQSLSQVVTRLRDFREGLLTGPLSPLPPHQQRDTALGELEMLHALAMGGDETAAASLPDAARTLLEVSREIFASSAGFQSDFRLVQAILDEVDNSLGRQLSVEEQMLAEMQTQTARLEQQLAAAENARQQAKASAQAQISAIQERAAAQIAILSEQVLTLLKILEEQRRTTGAVKDIPRIHTGGPDLGRPGDLGDKFRRTTPTHTGASRQDSDRQLAVAEDTNRILSTGFGGMMDRIEKLEQKVDGQTDELRRELEGAIR